LAKESVAQNILAAYSNATVKCNIILFQCISVFVSGQLDSKSATSISGPRAEIGCVPLIYDVCRLRWTHVNGGEGVSSMWTSKNN